MRILFLDIDGVLNRTGFHPGESVGLRSWIEPELARCLCGVLEATGASVVLSSDWRRGRELPHLREELAAAGVVCSLLGATPVLGQVRWREIDAWMAEHGVDLETIVIVDDSYDMGPLAARFVRTSLLNAWMTMQRGRSGSCSGSARQANAESAARRHSTSRGRLVPWSSPSRKRSVGDLRNCLS